MAEPSGAWTTNNKWKSDQEPFDSYRTEWSLGVGKMSLHGRLLGVSNGKETELWQYRVFWHPEAGEALVYQFGMGGTLGTGSMRLVKDGVIRSEATFYYPKLGTERIAHDLIEPDADTHITRSYEWDGKDWIFKREYVWKRQRTARRQASASLRSDHRALVVRDLQADVPSEPLGMAAELPLARVWPLPGAMAGLWSSAHSSMKPDRGPSC